MTKAIILLHGFMNNALVMTYLGANFKSKGYKVYHFNYNTRHYCEETLNKLDQLVSSLKESQLYLVGHSMGGLVIRNYLHDTKYKANTNYHKIKAVVTIASPHYQSVTAHNINKTLKGLLGTAGEVGLTRKLEEWHCGIAVGCMAGVYSSKLNANFFLLLNKNKSPSDGTVYVEEAILKTCTDSINIEGSHTGLLFKKEVANQVIHFLEDLKFKK